MPEQERHYDRDGLDYDDFRDDEYDRGLGNTYNDHYDDEYEHYRGKEDHYDHYNYGRDGSDSKEASDEPLRKHELNNLRFFFFSFRSRLAQILYGLTFLE